jgi:flagellar operon protein
METKQLNNILIPQISRLPEKDKKIGQTPKVDQNEFDKLLGQTLTEETHPEISLSVHAERRIKERNLNFDSAEYLKLQQAFEKLRNKGGRDSLVITDRAAYILDVNKNTVVTAMDKANLSENVFTKIDSTLIMN